MAAATVNKIFHACCPKFGRSLRYLKNTQNFPQISTITINRQFSNHLLNAVARSYVSKTCCPSRGSGRRVSPVYSSTKWMSNESSENPTLLNICVQLNNILSGDTSISSEQREVYMNIIEDAIAKTSDENVNIDTREVPPVELYYLASKMYALISLGEEAVQLATSLFKESAALGFQDAKYTYAQLLLRPTSTTSPNPQEAGQIFVELAQNGHPYSQFALAGMYSTGYGVEQSFDNSVALYKIAAQNGIVQGFNSIGRLYLNGQGVGKDDVKAVEYFKQGADAGDMNAYLSLGNCYSHGIGVETDFNKSFEYHTKAADLGNSNALHNVGTHYFLGKGTERDIHKAAQYFEKASDLGHVLSTVNLGKMYFEGFGVGLDWSKAKFYLNRAPEHNEAQLIMKEMEKEEKKQGITQS